MSSEYIPDWVNMPAVNPIPNNSGGIDWFRQLNAMPRYATALSNTQSAALPGWLRSAVATTESPGWGSLALGSAKALGGLFMGMKQYGLAKKTFNENKRQFQLNWGANRDLTNAQLADRQAGRIAASGPDGRHASVADYMAQYGIK